jgi:twitching motility protein PilT
VLATLHSASCIEALSRICMSFPAEIQGSIRAQLADCLVGVVCQRLDFLEAHHVRIPRCEVLQANVAAKGTIRSGQFSQIANVIQAGGEDGMWTFDRYQRWMEQKKDWVRATPAATVAEESGSVASPARANLSNVAVPKPVVPKAPVTKRSPAAPSTATAPRNEASAGEAPIEIPVEEDLDLAELAKQVERRSS